MIENDSPPPSPDTRTLKIIGIIFLFVDPCKQIIPRIHFPSTNGGILQDLNDDKDYDCLQLELVGNLAGNVLEPYGRA